MAITLDALNVVTADPSGTSSVAVGRSNVQCPSEDLVGTRLRAVPPQGKAGRQELVDAAPVEVHHLEAPARDIDALAGLRQASELDQNEAGGRVVGAALRQPDAE